MAVIVNDPAVIGETDMREQKHAEPYNDDSSAEGVSPLQCVTDAGFCVKQLLRKATSRTGRVVDGELWRDNPTASQLSQHMPLSMGKASSGSSCLLSCNVKSAFLQGDAVVCCRSSMCIVCTNSKISSLIPLAEGLLAKMPKGMFGLADALAETHRLAESSGEDLAEEISAASSHFVLVAWP